MILFDQSLKGFRDLTTFHTVAFSKLCTDGQTTWRKLRKSGLPQETSHETTGKGYALLGKEDINVPTSTQGVFSITWELLKCGKQDEACEKQRRSARWPKRMQTWWHQNLDILITSRDTLSTCINIKLEIHLAYTDSKDISKNFYHTEITNKSLVLLLLRILELITFWFLVIFS